MPVRKVEKSDSAWSAPGTTKSQEREFWSSARNPFSVVAVL